VPVGCVYQLALSPASTVTVSAGIALPEQTTGGVPTNRGGLRDGQSQLGLITVCCALHPLALTAVITVLVPTGRLLIKKPPVAVVTVPVGTLVTLVALVVALTRYCVPGRERHSGEARVRVGASLVPMVKLR
jgi:hypothetical protein